MALTPTADDLDAATAPCDSCAAPIVWALTDTGDATPINPQPSEAGTVLLTASGGELVAARLSRSQAAGARAAGQPLRTRHDVDCPRANGSRGRTRRR